MSDATRRLDDAARSGIEERLEKIPLARTLGVRLLRLEPGECDLAIDDRRDLDGIFDSLHGGILTTLADSALAFAALTLIGPDSAVATVELNIRFLAPCREAVVARSRVIKAGRTLITGEAELRGLASDTLFATCGMTYIRLDRKAPG